VSRFLTRAAVVAATTALAAGTLVAVVAPAASAAPAVTITTAAPYVDGQSVTVSVTGFPASDTVFVGPCIKGATTQAECTSDITDYAVISTDASGAGTGTAKVVQGALGSTPAWTCGPGAGHECDFVASSMSDPTAAASTRIIYKATITSLSPAGAYAGGESVKVSFTGAAPSQSNPAVAALICDLDVPLGDGSTACDFGGAAMATINASGAGTATIKVVKGKLGNPLNSTCGNATGQKCGIVITDFAGRLLGIAPLTYKASQALPAFPKSVKDGKKKALPKASKQGFKLVYASSTPKICKVVKIQVGGTSAKAVKGLKVGSCKVAVTSKGNATYAPVKSVKTIKVKR
jgi:hypothetical protein